MRLIVQQVVVTESGPPLLRPLVQWARRHLSLKQGDGWHLLIGGGWPGRLGADGAARLLRWSVEGNLLIAGAALPALTGQNSLPIGIQLVGSRYGDDRLLRAAQWVERVLSDRPMFSLL